MGAIVLWLSLVALAADPVAIPEPTPAPAIPPTPSWKLDPPDGMVRVTPAGPGEEVYAPDARSPRPRDAPLFRVTRSVSEVEPSRAAAAAMLGETAGLARVENLTTVAASLDRQAAWETVGSALDSETRAPLRVWQLVAFDAEGRYVRLFGQCPIAAAALWLPRFRAAAASFDE